MFGLKRRRRERIRRRPFPAAWEAILERNVAVWSRLSAEDRAELRGHVQVFLAEKTFEGCGGLEITDEIRVTVAAQACVLLLHRETDYYPGTRSILVYPMAYRAPTRRRTPDGLIVEEVQARLGEAWREGPVVLSWDDVLRGAADAADGHNVVFHEFAHQLDGESGANEGAPALPRASRYVAWARVLGAEYEHLLDDLMHHHRHLIDAYGATSPAEFFAVVTEAFFERPRALKRRHAALYEQLALFYRQDPSGWGRGEEAASAPGEPGIPDGPVPPPA
jgi:hypothetical protein